MRSNQPISPDNTISTRSGDFKHPTSNTYVQLEKRRGVEKGITKIWKGRKVLKVYFMNAETLDQWGEEEILSTSTIMSWASAWNSPILPKIPRFEETKNITKADIRVKFSGNV